MRKVTIPKRSGGTRLIYVPSWEEKTALRSIAGTLTSKAAKADRSGVAHGFVRYRSPVTNARAHIGHAYTVSFDLKNFFESVTPDKLVGKLSQSELDMVIVDGAARQGLPTSPAVANLAASELDKAILKWIAKRGKQIIYTRYADDLTFSFDDAALIEILRQSIPQIVSRCGFAVNPKKVRVQSATAGRRIVCGVAVGENEIYPTRAARRRLRAAIHQGNTAQINGLGEWCKLRPPSRKMGMNHTELDELEAVCKAWRLTIPKALRSLDIKKSFEPTDLGEHCEIIIDPIYILGMSTWTSGWRSCMTQPDGMYRRGVWVWVGLPGTAIAAKMSDHDMTVAGVTRKKMAARVLIHKLRDGRMVFDRFYGGTEAMAELETQLRLAGFISIAEARKIGGSDDRVVGHITRATKPWTDNLKAVDIKLTRGGKARVFTI
ncbi:MAG: RNA-directed DNA polymerase [Nitrososphaerota archaeon]|nr:RNA-directed DNA polymerase [Nitrososphaerota archaeon]